MLFETELLTPARKFDRTKILHQFCELLCSAIAFSHAGNVVKFCLGCWMDPFYSYGTNLLGKTRKDALRFLGLITGLRPEAVYKIKTDGYFNSWIVSVEVDPEEMKIKFDETLKESVYISGFKVDSLCEFAPGSLLLAVQTNNVILIVQSWLVVRETNVSGSFSVSESLLFPGFNIDTFPVIFVLGKTSYSMLNVTTGNRDVLVQGSAQNDYRQHPVIMRGLEDDRISIDFVIAQLNQIKG